MQSFFKSVLSRGSLWKRNIFWGGVGDGGHNHPSARTSSNLLWMGRIHKNDGKIPKRRLSTKFADFFFLRFAGFCFKVETDPWKVFSLPVCKSCYGRFKMNLLPIQFFWGLCKNKIKTQSQTTKTKMEAVVHRLPSDNQLLGIFRHCFPTRLFLPAPKLAPPTLDWGSGDLFSGSRKPGSPPHIYCGKMGFSSPFCIPQFAWVLINFEALNSEPCFPKEGWATLTQSTWGARVEERQMKPDIKFGIQTALKSSLLLK